MKVSRSFAIFADVTMFTEISNSSDLFIIPLDDAYDTYVEIDNDLQVNINIDNARVAKAHI